MVCHFPVIGKWAYSVFSFSLSEKTVAKTVRAVNLENLLPSFSNAPCAQYPCSLAYLQRSKPLAWISDLEPLQQHVEHSLLDKQMLDRKTRWN